MMERRTFNEILQDAFKRSFGERPVALREMTTVILRDKRIIILEPTTQVMFTRVRSARGRRRDRMWNLAIIVPTPNAVNEVLGETIVLHVQPDNNGSKITRATDQQIERAHTLLARSTRHPMLVQ